MLDSSQHIYLQPVGVALNMPPIDSDNGRVGIGTTSPNRKLQVAGATAITNSGDTGAFLFDPAGSVNTLLSRAGQSSTTALPLAVKMGNAEAMRIDGSGQVGIGTGSSIDELLHVESSSTTVRLKVQSTATNSYPGVRFTNDARTYDLQIDGATDALRIYDATASTERLRIDSSGRVGIGTTSPGAKLTVQDGANAAGAILVGANYDSTGLTNNQTKLAPIHMPHYTNAEESIRLIAGYSDASQSIVSVGGGTASANVATKVQIFTAADTTTTGGTAAITVDSSQRVGIGTTSPVRNLQIGNNTEDHEIISLQSSTTGKGSIYFGDNTATAAEYAGMIRYDHSDDAMAFRTQSQERMRITSSGRVGIGRTDPQQLLHLSSTNTYIALSDSADSGSAGILFRRTDNDQNRGNIVYNFDNDFLSFRVSDNGAGESMRIDSSGNVGIGTTSPSYLLDAQYQSNRYFQLRFAKPYARYDDNAMIDAFTFQNLGTTASGHGSKIEFIVGTSVSSNSSSIQAQRDGAAGNTNLVFGTNSTEQMRIRADGATLIGTTSSTINSSNFGTRISGANTAPGYFATSRNVGTGNEVAQFFGQSGELRIKGDGDCENTNNRYTGISDIKLKENIVDASSQWEDIKALQVRNYNFKEETGYGTHTQIGLVAQEVETVCPGLVGETNDTDDELNETGTVTKSVAYSVLYMKAVKALQEAMDRIETLEAKVAALEAG